MDSLPLPKHLWWPWDQPADRIAFTRSFSLSHPSPGRLYVACSGEYNAWLDGESLVIPQGYLPSWRSLHILPVELAAGEHRLTFEARACGSQQPFFMANLDWDENGAPRRLATDAAWRMCADPQPGWEEDASQSRAAWAFDGVWSEPWGMPCNAPEDFLRFTTGCQVVERQKQTTVAELRPGPASLGSALDLRPDGSAVFTPPLPHPVSLPRIELARPRLEWYRSREAHSLINNAWLDLFEQRCPTLIFDVGQETFARLRLSLRGGGPAVVAVTTGESLHEVDRYMRRVTDLCVLRDGESFATAPTGFRYVKVMVLGATGSAVLDPLEGQHIRYPLSAQGEFRCSDDLLNQIFKLSVRTLHLCMQNEIWDGIKRDQLPWMGDLYTEALAAYLLFGDSRLARRSLAVLAEVGPAPRPPVERMRSPGLQSVWSTDGGDINDIPAYTMWWVIGLWDYWWYCGDSSLIEELKTEIEATLEHICSWVGDDGIWRQQSGWDFIDWAPLSQEERAIYCHLLACRALDAGIRLLELGGEGDTAGLRQKHARMLAAARQTWWRDGQRLLGGSHHTNSAAILSGALSSAEAEKVFGDALQSDPPLSMTYWHRFLDLTAAQQVGQINWGLEYIRRHWGQAVQIGATTLWEAFDSAWIGDDPHAVSMVGAGYARYGGYETSLCHGWSSGPAAWLLSAVLGITPEQPGFTRFTFQPDLGDLEWAEGAIPLKDGILRVRLDKNGGKPRARLEIPPGVEWSAPAALRQSWQIEVSGG